MTPDREDIVKIRKKVDVYLNVGRFDAAEKLLKATLAEYGPLANIHNLLGVTYHKQSKFPEALTHFKRAIECNHTFIEASINLSATLCDLSKYEEAEKVFKKIEDSIDNRTGQPVMVLGRIANSHAKTGRLYEESGMLTDAIREYKKALSLFYPLPDIQLRLAKLYLNLEKFEDSRKIFEDLLNIDPNSAYARTGLGIVQFKLGRSDLAGQQWDIAHKNSPNNLIAKAYHHVSNSWPKD